MYRYTPPATYINILLDDGGLGDCIARLPAIKYLYDNHPQIRAYVWVPDFFYEFAKNSLRHTKDRFLISKWSDGAKYFVSGHPTKSFRQSTVGNLGLHMTEHAFYVINGTTPSDTTNSYNYLQPDLSSIDVTKFNLPEKYVVVSTGYTAEVRQFLPEYINSVVQHIKSKGYEVVFLGKKETESGVDFKIKGEFKNEIDYLAGIDLIDKTSLFEATKVCANSKCVVGLDNGILHLAGCTDTYIVGGFTTVNPNHRMPYRSGILGNGYFPVVPPESLECRFCQSNMQFTYKHDFKDCFYKDLKCVQELNAELYIKELDKIL